MGNIMSWEDIKMSEQTGNMKCLCLWKGGRHIVYGMVLEGLQIWHGNVVTMVMMIYLLICMVL